MNNQYSNILVEIITLTDIKTLFYNNKKDE